MKPLFKFLLSLVILTGTAFAQAPGPATATLKEAYIPLPGGGKAIYGSAGTLIDYQRPDGSGNVRIVSTPSQTIQTSVEIAPFGEDFDDNLGTGFYDFSFNQMGQEDGTAGGVGKGYGALYSTPNREYSAVQGRWLSPDPIMGVNGYVYASNNPLMRSDPSGLQDGGGCDFCITWDSSSGDNGISWGWGPDGGWWGGASSWGWGWWGGTWEDGVPGGKALKSLFSSTARAAVNAPVKFTYFLLDASDKTTDFGANVVHSVGRAVLDTITYIPCDYHCQAVGTVRSDTSGVLMFVTAGIGYGANSAAGSLARSIESTSGEAAIASSSYNFYNVLDTKGVFEVAESPSLAGPGRLGSQNGVAFQRFMRSPDGILRSNGKPGMSYYQESMDGQGMWRTSNHWGMMSRNNWTLGSPETMRLLGGTPVEANFWYFENPVSGYIKYNNMTPIQK